MSAMAADAREPVWSQHLTDPLARVIPAARRPVAVVAIKTVHTIAFVLIAAMIVLVAWDGLRGRATRRTVAATGVAFAESAVFASNNRVCPLTPLAEELGASSGSVTDIFLPDWLSRRIPVLFGGLLVIGVGLHLAAWRRGRTSARRVPDVPPYGVR